MRRYVWSELTAAERSAALARPQQRSERALVQRVRSIVDDVRTRGWEALAQQARVIDGADPQLVPVAPIAEEARRTLAPDQLAALELAARNLRAFHEAQRPSDTALETVPGLTVRKLWRPIDRIGLYVPGGATPLFSSLLHQAIPALAAGVPELVVCTPPLPEGGLAPMIALAADLCGVEAVWTMGGAQAIAALAFGAGEVPRVAKICGPGNAWVAEAKTYVASLPGGPAIDMPAGPSELMVIADSTVDPAWVAADLLSQAEHDPSAQVLLVATEVAVADAVCAELRLFAPTLPRHKIIEQSLAGAAILIARSLEEAADIANAYAPEHLCLAVKDAAALVPQIRNAGAVFAGHAAAETFGDYLAGSSHVLPTDGAARAWSGINVHSFLKAMTVQEVSPEAARTLAAPAAALARLEDLEAHARAADVRGVSKEAVQAELVEALPSSSPTQEKDSPSTGSGRSEV
ncbi:MAG TPA: histidinol dehydrogenase, partial [Allosphingosinicella sp.]|nr:histidinol dehydrogenase [Allosphingosinicella sp.]